MLNWLHRFSIRHPILVVAIGLLVTAAAAPGIAKLRLRTDGQALVPEHAAAVQLDRRIRAEFGVHDPILVLIRPRHAQGIFDSHTLALVANLTQAIAGLPGVDSARVSSLATEPSDRMWPRTLVSQRLLEPIPRTPAEIDRLRGDLEALDLLRGTLVSFDGAATAILVASPPDADRSALVAALRGAIARADTAGHDVDVIGAPVAEALLGVHVLEDLGAGRHATGVARQAGGGGTLSDLRVAIARHVGLLPLSIGVMALVFVIWFRSVIATLLPLMEVGACLAFVFGVMGWAGVPVYLTLAVLPVILVSMGLADEIHVFTHYVRQRAARPREPIAAVVRATMDEMCLPVVATAVTTAVGFLSFATSPLPPVRAFGVLTAVGIVFCMLWTLTVIPALLVLLAPGGFRVPRVVEDRTGMPPAWVRGAARLGRWPVLTLILVGLGLWSCVPGIRRLTVQDSWISGFAPDSDFYRATRYFNQHFYGTHRLLLVLDAGRVERRTTLTVADMTFEDLRLPADLVADPSVLAGCSLVVSRREPKAPAKPDPWFRPSFWGSVVERATLRDGRIVVAPPLMHGSPLFLLSPAPGETLDVVVRSHRLAQHDVLRRVDELERFVRSQSRYAVGGVIGPPDHVALAEFVANQREPEFRVVPTEQGRVRWLWETIARVRGPERVREIVDADYRRGVVTVFLKDANYQDTARLMSAIRAYEREHLVPARIELSFAGDVAVSQALIQAIVHSQVRSILLSLLGIVIVTALLFRSLRWGLACVVPAGLAVAATFAVMGASGMPLGVATSMFAAMVLGIGVDFAIHMVERYRLAIARGASRDDAVAEALAVTGPAIAVNGLAVALGFGILVLSRVPANGWLGAITVVSLLACLLATFLVMPALLRLGGGSRARTETAE